MKCAIDDTPALGFELIPHPTLANEYYVTCMGVDNEPLYLQMEYKRLTSTSHSRWNSDAERRCVDWQGSGQTAFPIPNWDTLSTFEIID